MSVNDKSDSTPSAATMRLKGSRDRTLDRRARRSGGSFVRGDRNADGCPDRARNHDDLSKLVFAAKNRREDRRVQSPIRRSRHGKTEF